MTRLSAFVHSSSILIEKQQRKANNLQREQKRTTKRTKSAIDQIFGVRIKVSSLLILKLSSNMRNAMTNIRVGQAYTQKVLCSTHFVIDSEFVAEVRRVQAISKTDHVYKLGSKCDVIFYNKELYTSFKVYFLILIFTANFLAKFYENGALL